MKAAFLGLMDVLRRPQLQQPYEGRSEQRAALRSMTSALIGRYIKGLKLREPTSDNPRRVERDPQFDMELMTEDQAPRMYGRLTGTKLGSVLDVVIR